MCMCTFSVYQSVLNEFFSAHQSVLNEVCHKLDRDRLSWAIGKQEMRWEAGGKPAADANTHYTPTMHRQRQATYVIHSRAFSPESASREQPGLC